MTAALEALRAALAASPDLAERLRAESSAGYDEWRVQDPKDGAYCIAFSWPGTLHPELEARAWLADQQDRFPQGRYADYVVACVRVVPTKDRLLREAADALQAAPELLAEVDRLKAEREALLRYFTASRRVINTIGHPEATAADEHAAEAEFEAATVAARAALKEQS